jgi:hypothetical protein
MGWRNHAPSLKSISVAFPALLKLPAWPNTSPIRQQGTHYHIYRTKNSINDPILDGKEYPTCLGGRSFQGGPVKGIRGPLRLQLQRKMCKWSPSLHGLFFLSCFLNIVPLYMHHTSSLATTLLLSFLSGYIIPLSTISILGTISPVTTLLPSFLS